MSDFPLAGLSQGFKTSKFREYRLLFARYLRPQAPQVIWMAALLLAGIALELANPQIIRYFLDTAQSSSNPRPLLFAGVLFIAFAILQQGLTLGADYLSKTIGWTATNHLRADLALHCLHLDMPFHKSHTPGELIDRIDGDVSQLANFFSKFSIRILGDGLLVLGILTLLFVENTWMGLGMLLYTAVTLLVLGYIQNLAVPRWAAERQAGALLYGYIEERISGAEEIRAAGAESHAMRRLYEFSRVFTNKTRAAAVVAGLAFNLTNLVYVIGYAAGLALAVYLFSHGQASLGTAYLITYYISMLSTPLQSIRAQVEDLQQASASIQRVQELFAIQPQVTPPGLSMQALPAGALSIEFKDVSFKYRDGPNDDDGEANVLNNISFTLLPGRVLGILGRTGSGKSTLTRLLFHFYDPSQGTIRLGGADLRNVTLADLRRQVGMVTQDVQLFQASLRENLAFFDANIQDARLEQALLTLQLSEWVQSLPEGLDTALAGGQNLSAGEAQLLAFARVLLKDPGLVILDEASSRLDPATEALMERAIDHLFSGRTGVVIAHRLKTIQRADDLLILDEGRIVEYGPRQALANDPSSRFYHLLQTGLEEALA
jgi:ABC-type multidrug transport system fused ATPase/permease subunit